MDVGRFTFIAATALAIIFNQRRRRCVSLAKQWRADSKMCRVMAGINTSID